MSCLNSIVTLGICPDEDSSSSGLTLVDAAGITLRSLSSGATDTYQSGINMAMQKKNLSIIQVRNDFLGALQMSNIIPNISNTEHSSGDYYNSSVGTYAGFRGIVLHGLGRGLRNNYIKDISLYPLSDGIAELKIEYKLNNNIVSTSVDVSLTGGQVNIFNSSNLDILPFAFPDYATEVKILVDQTDIAFNSNVIKCHKGCKGLPNDCGWVDGWNGTGSARKEGYGVSITFYCKCDYDRIMCDLDKPYFGELIWLKWQINVFDEVLKSDRFNDVTIYGRGDLANVIADLRNSYNLKWNQLMEGMFTVLKNYKDDCLNCRRTRLVTNI